jgi:hypothetical protein
MSETNRFPKLGINTLDLMEHIDRLLDRAAGEDRDEMGAVNWADLGIADIEYRISILHPEDGPCCVITVEEASPHSGLQQWLNIQLDAARFPNTHIECEW